MLRARALFEKFQRLLSGRAADVLKQASAIRTRATPPATKRRSPSTSAPAAIRPQPPLHQPQTRPQAPPFRLPHSPPPQTPSPLVSRPGTPVAAGGAPRPQGEAVPPTPPANAPHTATSADDKPTRKPLRTLAGNYVISEYVRNHCVIFDDGLVWVLQGYTTDATVLTALRYARDNKSPQNLQEITVITDSEMITAAYSGSTTEALVDDTEAYTEAQNIFRDIMDTGALHGVNEIQIEHRGEYADVKFEINDVMSDNIFPLHKSVADRILALAYNIADIKDGPRQVSRPQQAAINRPDKLPPGVLTARMEFLPLADGMFLKIRITYRKHALMKGGLARAGLMPESLKTLRQLLSMNSGLVTFSGPIGSGKTVLGTAFILEISELRGNRLCIYSIEDPTEGIDPRILPIVITHDDNDPRDPYERALLPALRVHPHIVRIGECRTLGAVLAAYNVSILGKTLSVTTLHADEGLDVPESYTRLGLPKEKAYDYRRHGGWINQRLIPTICRHCATSLTATNISTNPVRQEIREAFYSALGETSISKFLFRGPGCPHCRPRNKKACDTCTDRQEGVDCHTACSNGKQGVLVVGMPGITGRIPAAEVIRPTRELMDRLRQPGGYDDARKYWLHDMSGKSLRLHAWQHLQAGRIGVEEFLDSGLTPEQLAFDLKTVGVLHW